MEPFFILIAAIVTAGCTALATIYVAKRQHSGEIDTSDAAQLWLEAQHMRRELRDEVVALRGVISDLRERSVVMQKVISDLQGKAVETQAIIADLRDGLKKLGS